MLDVYHIDNKMKPGATGVCPGQTGDIMYRRGR